MGYYNWKYFGVNGIDYEEQAGGLRPAYIEKKEGGSAPGKTPGAKTKPVFTSLKKALNQNVYFFFLLVLAAAFLVVVLAAEPFLAAGLALAAAFFAVVFLAAGLAGLFFCAANLRALLAASLPLPIGFLQQRMPTSAQPQGSVTVRINPQTSQLKRSPVFNFGMSKSSWNEISGATQSCVY